MALTPDTFLERFPQFTVMKNGETRISNALASAYLHAGPALGALRDEAAGYYAAHLLATNPANENMAMVKGQPGTTIYMLEFERIVATARPIGAVGGGGTLPPTPYGC